MKHAIILPDGAADEPLPQLGNQTPLQKANTPNMDTVAMSGRLGRVVTVPKGFTPATDVATLSLFGYQPARYYSGRAPIEAAAQGLEIKEDEIVFRCNFVTILDGKMKDFTAGHIKQAEADALIADLNNLFADEPLSFYAGVSYRNLLIVGNAGNMRLITAPPHDIPDQSVASHQPAGAGSDRVIAIMDRAREIIRKHEVNKTREAAGEKPITDIWLWGQGRPTVLEPFADRFGVMGTVITGVDIIRGLAVCMGMNLIEVEGATGYIDTNFEGKGEAGIKALDDYDLVVVHIEAPDEAGHLGDAEEKVKALERIDEYIVGPMLKKLRTFDEWRMMIAPDHPTPVSTTAHSDVPPPFCYAGTGIDAIEKRPFTEAEAEAGGWFVDPGHEMIVGFMK